MRLFLPAASPRVVLWQTAQSFAKISDGLLPWSIFVWAYAIGANAANRGSAATKPILGATRRNTLISLIPIGLLIILTPNQPYVGVAWQVPSQGQFCGIAG